MYKFCSCIGPNKLSVCSFELNYVTCTFHALLLAMYVILILLLHYFCSVYISAAPLDYTAQPVLFLPFFPGQELQCLDVSIAQDDTPENTECFTAVLGTTSLNVLLNSSALTATVKIVDDDGMCIINAIQNAILVVQDCVCQGFSFHTHNSSLKGATKLTFAPFCFF